MTSKRTVHPRRTDGNQAQIIADLERIGATVADTHELGKGFPDIVVGYKGRSYLIEIKMPGEKLTASELRWHDGWRGQVAIVTCSEDAIALVSGEEAMPY